LFVRNKVLTVNALLDSGATGLFIDAEFVLAKNLTTNQLPKAIPVYNIDGSLNHLGAVKETVDLIIWYKDHTEWATFHVTALGGVPIILGHPWLAQHNPQINWKMGEVTMSHCPSSCHIHYIQAQQHWREWVKQIWVASTVSQQLAETANKHQVTKSFQQAVPSPYHRFEPVFSKESFDELPKHKKWDHMIELIPGATEFSTKLYPMSPKEQIELDQFLEENLKSGRIWPSKSPMASPVFFIKKKDGSLRFVQDYQKLNAITICNRYPLPLVSDIMSWVTNARFFMKLDAQWGYNNVRIQEGDEWKAAFQTNRGLFEPLVMFFSLCNSPATFQMMMNDLFCTLIEEGAVAVYMDDILIFTRTLKEHHSIISRVLQVLQENNLYLRPDKCVFEVRQVEFLGLILSENQVEMDPVKI
jgi:Reverse transcriptase (RNA-dependent DNA polymerase)/Retroviral aspartyl protease